MPAEPAARRLAELRFTGLGSTSPRLLDDLVAEVSRRVAAPCRLAPPLPELTGHPIDGRLQLDADEMLAALERACRGQPLTIGVTHDDLGRKVFSYIFGLSRIGGGAVLVSTARLDPVFYGLPPDPRLTVRRAAAEVLHEVGHTAGLGHCDRVDCLMNFAHDAERIDLRGLAFCPDCRPRLPPGFLP